MNDCIKVDTLFNIKEGTQSEVLSFKTISQMKKTKVQSTNIRTQYILMREMMVMKSSRLMMYKETQELEQRERGHIFLN